MSLVRQCSLLKKHAAFHDHNTFVQFLLAGHQKRVPFCKNERMLDLPKNICGFCRRSISEDNQCSMLDATTTSQPWSKPCRHCWRILLAVVNQGDLKQWELVKFYVKPDGTNWLDSDRKFAFDNERPEGMCYKPMPDTIVQEVFYPCLEGKKEKLLKICVPSGSQVATDHASLSTPCSVKGWKEVEPQWTASVDVLHKEVQSLHDENVLLVITNAELRGENDNLRAKHAKLERENQDLAAKSLKLALDVEALAQTNATLTANLKIVAEQLAVTEVKANEAGKRAQELFARAGGAHIKRDFRRLNKSVSAFPEGDDLKDAFQTPFLQFECFACDLLTALCSLGHSDAAANGLLVSQLMKPMYEVTHNYVAAILSDKAAAMQATFQDTVPTDLTHDTITKQFWFTRMQEVVPKLISNLSDEKIMQLMREMGDLVPAAHAQMLLDGEQGLIENTENDLRIPQVVRTLLLLFTYAMLSDPYCYLQPAPGTTVAYHADRCNEILSPGTRKYGQIKEGDVVEVVLCGLYFEDTASEEGAFERVRPVVKCCVRRIML